MRNFQPQPGATGLGLGGLIPLMQASSQELQALPLPDTNLQQFDPSQGQWEIRTSTPTAGHDGPDPQTQAILDQINAYCRR